MYFLGYSCLLQHFAQLIDFILSIASLVGTDLEVGSCFEMPPLSRGVFSLGTKWNGMSWFHSTGMGWFRSCVWLGQKMYNGMVPSYVQLGQKSGMEWFRSIFGCI
jgi:hypothetical protein